MVAEVLSQDEIDELLTAISAGDVQSDDVKEETINKKIKIYDFKRPDKFSKEQIRTINRIHETFARLVNTFFSTQLRSMVSVDVVSVDQLTYEEFIRSIANPTVMGIFSLGTLEGNAVIEINLGIVFAILDRLFGGLGTSLEEIRVLTEIEEAVIRRIILKILDYLKEAWMQVIELSPRLEMIETNPQFTQIVSPSDMILLVTVEVKIGEVEGIINICIPYIVLEPVVGKLTTQSWFTPVKKEVSTESHISLETKVRRALKEVIVELGSTSIAVNEMLQLKVGDCVVLPTKKDDSIKVKVGNRVKFLGRPGVVDNNSAVYVEKVIKDEEEILIYER